MFAKLNEVEKESTIIEFIICNLWIHMHATRIKQYLADSLFVVKWMHAMHVHELSYIVTFHCGMCSQGITTSLPQLQRTT